jgi:hypothetical protein
VEFKEENYYLELCFHKGDRAPLDLMWLAYITPDSHIHVDGRLRIYFDDKPFSSKDQKTWFGHVSSKPCDLTTEEGAKDMLQQYLDLTKEIVKEYVPFIEQDGDKIELHCFGNEVTQTIKAANKPWMHISKGTIAQAANSDGHSVVRK